MTLSQVSGVVKKYGIQVIRNKWTIPYLILFPVFFLALCWFGFGASDIGVTKTYDLGIINNDAGLGNEVRELLGSEEMQEWFPHSADVINNGFSVELIGIFNSTKYSNETDAKRIFDVTLLTSTQEGMEKLEKRELDVMIEFSPAFSNASLAILNQNWKMNYDRYLHEMIQDYIPSAPDLPVLDNETIVITGDETYFNYKLARSIVIMMLERYQDIGSVLGSPGGTITLAFNEDYLVSLPKYTIFDIMIPGLIVFGIVIQPSVFAGIMCIEFQSDSRTFDRLKLASLPASSYVLGTLIIQIPVIFIQNVILFATSLFFGFDPQGDVILAFIITLAVIPFTVSLNYLTAAFISNGEAAEIILGFGGPVLVFMAGAFSTLPHLVIFPNSFPTGSGIARDFLIWDLLPLTHAVNSISGILLHGFTLEQVSIDIAANVGLSLVILLVSIIIFTKLRFRST